MEEERLTIQEQALEHFGNLHQLLKYIEELAESIAATARHLATGTDETYNSMTEEQGDVENVTAYPRLIFGNEDIDNAKQAKLERLAETLRGKG